MEKFYRMLPAFHTPGVFSDKEFEITRLIIRGLHLNYYKVKAMAHLHGLVVNATEITLVTEALVTVII